MRTKCVLATVLLMLAGAPATTLAAAVCGNGVIETGEDCDGANVGGKTCTSVSSGFVQGGTLACGPDCKFDMTDCRRVFIQSLVPAKGGPSKNRCQLEWTAVGASVKGTQVQCSEGDASCDRDGQFNNMCTMTLQLCLNVPDPKVSGCAFMNAPGQVFRVEVLSPGLGSQFGQSVAAGIVSAAQELAAGAGVTAHVGGNAVAYNPPITNFSCGTGTVRIPLRGTDQRARPGKVRVRARSSDRSGKIKATGNLTLICAP